MLACRSMGALFDDQLDHALKIVPHVHRADTQRLDALASAPGVPADVAIRIGTEVMCKAIHLDRKRGFEAEEVQDVRTKRMLTTKFESCRAALQHVPEPSL